MAIKGDPTFRWPPTMRTKPNKHDRNKFYEYHNDHGHSTEDCMVLKREIESFVNSGGLMRFLVNERAQNRNP